MSWRTRVATLLTAALTMLAVLAPAAMADKFVNNQQGGGSSATGGGGGNATGGGGGNATGGSVGNVSGGNASVGDINVNAGNGKDK